MAYYDRMRVMKFDESQPRDDHGRWAAEDTGGALKPGDKALVYRLGRADNTKLDAANAGNAIGVATHLTNVDDAEKPGQEFGTGDTIHAYEVTMPNYIGGYEPILGNDPWGGGRVGRTASNGNVWYSFAKGHSADVKYKGSVSLDEARGALEKLTSENPRPLDPKDSFDSWMMKHQPGKHPDITRSFDMAGAVKGGEAIRRAFRAKYPEHG